MGIRTHVEMETHAILMGLRHCREMKIHHVLIDSDSLSAVKMIRKEWRIPWCISRENWGNSTSCDTNYAKIRHAYIKANQFADTIAKITPNQENFIQFQSPSVAIKMQKGTQYWQGTISISEDQNRTNNYTRILMLNYQKEKVLKLIKTSLKSTTSIELVSYCRCYSSLQINL